MIPQAKKDSVKPEEVLSQNDKRWLRLREIIRAQSLKLGEFTLTSGRQSTYLFQLRQTALLPEGAALIAEYMRRQELGAIGGLELGAVPLVSAVAAISHLKAYPVDAFFVRKQAKAHGARERLYGHLRAGAKVLMVDDVATTGGSILKAIEGMRSECPAAHCARALAIVDREEGAVQNLTQMGIRLAAIFKKSDFPEI